MYAIFGRVMFYLSKGIDEIPKRQNIQYVERRQDMHIEISKGLYNLSQMVSSKVRSFFGERFSGLQSNDDVRDERSMVVYR